ncbi:MAG: 50S ribosome-binding GTPase [Ruminococcus flavefaciens]|nr:50S ribosome-binding GTPase [Ruminococcus flavefaciens]
MQDIKYDIEQLTSRFIDWFKSQDNAEKDYLTKIDKEVLSLLCAEKPKVMVYGIYNAGKSTLINAIIGKEVAEMRDRPTTYKIDEYDNGDYTLVDSPGVDAPIEHQQITEDNIESCHVILYVISTKGGFESIKNYENMYRLIKTEKPFIIVINDKNGENDINNSENINSIKCKILENLQKISGNYHIENLFDTIAVNGKRALQGQLQGKEKLVELSNLSMIKNRILHFLHSQSAMSIYKAPVNNLISMLDEMIADTEEKTNLGSNKIFTSYLSDIRAQRNSFMDEIPCRINMMVRRYERTLIESAYSKNISSWESNIQSMYREFEDMYTEHIRNLMSYFKEKYIGVDFSGMTAKNISGNISGYSMVDFEGNQEKHTNSNSDSSENDNYSSGMDMLSTAVDAARSIMSPNPVPNPKLILKVFSKIFTSKKEKELAELSRLLKESTERNLIAAENAINEARRRQDIRIAVETQSHKIRIEMCTLMTAQLSAVFEKAEECILVSANQNQHEMDKLLDVCKQLNAFKTEAVTIKNRIR